MSLLDIIQRARSNREEEICTAPGQVLAPGHDRRTRGVMASVLNDNEREVFFDALEAVRGDNNDLDSSHLSTIQKGLLEALYSDDEKIARINAALEKELKTFHFPGVKTSQIKQHIENLKGNYSLFHDKKTGKVNSRILLGAILGKEYIAESSEQLPNKLYVEDMKDSYNDMNPDNRLSQEDLDKLVTWKGLSREIKDGTTILNIPLAGRYICTNNADLDYSDFDNDGKRSINNIYNSERFVNFVASLKERLYLPEQYQQRRDDRIYAIKERLNITDPDIIDVQYVKSQREMYGDDFLPLNHPLTRIYGSIALLRGGKRRESDYFDVLEDGPIENKLVLSVEVYDGGVCILQSDGLIKAIGNARTFPFA